jgi:hypothetical protein
VITRRDGRPFDVQGLAAELERGLEKVRGRKGATCP